MPVCPCVADSFGKVLMKGIADYYNKCMDMQEFGSKMYSLQQNLPEHISYVESFYILSYADDPLSWGDEKQARELYENAIGYYN